MQKNIVISFQKCGFTIALPMRYIWIETAKSDLKLTMIAKLLFSICLCLSETPKNNRGIFENTSIHRSKVGSLDISSAQHQKKAKCKHYKRTHSDHSSQLKKKFF